jgi:hypothetical protein
MQEIRGNAKTIRSLLSGARYSIDYYQREYKWEKKQVAQLLEDLATKFLASYEEGHERSAVEHYGHYFLGSIIISDKQGEKFIIDGQQRLTTLTLLLIYLQNLLSDPEDKAQVADLIFAKKFGKKAFNLEVPERVACMEALYNDEPFDATGQPESIRNIVARYTDIQELFSEELTGCALPYFVDWLIENVHLVEITAYLDEDAYTIFETMNDRGLSLSLTEMLKGYLLTNITDEAQRLTAGRVWKERIGDLLELGKDEDADCLKSWLRSQHANSIRERKSGATPQDFDRIGTEFHRWVREHHETLNLNTSSDFFRFIERELPFYARQYIRLRQAASQLTPGFETVFYNAHHNFTLQYPVLLAPLQPSDPEGEIERKLRVTGAYLDILIARRIWNWHAIDYSTMQYAMFLVMRDIRRKSATAVAEILRGKLDAEKETFASNNRFILHGQNGRQIHRILARLTDYLETQSGMPSHYTEYATRSGKSGYEIEHIWAYHPERHEDEFAHPQDFAEYRNRIGGLLLLPKLFNASFSDLAYEKKLEHYNNQNLLARSLHPQCYDHNPGFLAYIKRSGLPFTPHPQFKKTDLDARQELYGRIAEEIWHPARLEREAVS